MPDKLEIESVALGKMRGEDKGGRGEGMAAEEEG